jgi:ribosome assembly protein YihI (activator of Der GTPase)
MIGIEIKFNVGPFKVNRKTSTLVENDIEKLSKDEALKQRYLLWLNWGRRMSVEDEKYVNEIRKRYKNIKIIAISLSH